MKPENHSRPLRSGFTTGACAAAAAVAAWLRLNRQTPDRIDLLFPDEQIRQIPVFESGQDRTSARATIVKDAGDDIDCTHNARISASIRSAENSDVQPEDFEESCGQATLILRGGNGVGKVTRRGLDVPAGKWAVNPVPRRMICDNLAHAGLGKTNETWLVEISVENGELLAKKTLNPTLGIIGGLSILGTSGIVVPCSNEAYIATIKTLLRGAHESGLKTAVLVTGGKTHRALREAFPDIDEAAFVRFGDFIRDALKYCREYRFETVIIGCMPGKLAKYAEGHAYTHAHTVGQSMAVLADLLNAQGLPGGLCEHCRRTRSVRELLEELSSEEKASVLTALKRKAQENLSAWAGGCRIQLHVLDFKDQRCL